FVAQSDFCYGLNPHHGYFHCFCYRPVLNRGLRSEPFTGCFLLIFFYQDDYKKGWKKKVVSLGGVTRAAPTPAAAHPPPDLLLHLAAAGAGRRKPVHLRGRRRRGLS